MVNTSLKNIDFLIQNKDQINDLELEAIYNLSVRYPYSSFCHFFLYSVLKKQNRTGVENVLKKTAIRFHDRSLLKKLFENSMVKQNTKERIEDTDIEEIENKEQEKVLNENVYSNIINDNIIQEVTETKGRVHKEKKEERQESSEQKMDIKLDLDIKTEENGDFSSEGDSGSNDGLLKKLGK